jgi:hypothetical protein
MKAGCDDSSSTKMALSPGDGSTTDIIQMLFAISSQITSNYLGLQDGMIQTDLRLSAKFQRVVQDNNTFQQGIRAELDTLRNFS